MSKQTRVLIIGCGDVGLRIVPLLPRPARIFALTHDPNRLNTLRKAGVHPMYGDLDSPSSLHRLAGLATQVIYLAPPPSHGTRDPRLRALLPRLGKIRSLVYISTTGVYGDCQGAYFDETRATRPQTARAQRRVDAEQTLRSWALHARVRVVIVRVPGIYAAHRLPLERLRAATPVLRADEDVYSNHIHADDLARIAVAALYKGAPQRIYHAVDDSQLKMADYFDLLADTFGLARPPRVARTQLAQSLSPVQLSFMSESRRLANQRIKQELGVRLRYANVGEGLAQACLIPTT